MSSARSASLAKADFLLDSLQSQIIRQSVKSAYRRNGWTLERLHLESGVSLRAIKYRLKQGRFYSRVARSLCASLGLSLPNQLERAERARRGENLQTLMDACVRARAGGNIGVLPPLVKLTGWLLQRCVASGLTPSMLIRSQPSATPACLMFDLSVAAGSAFELQLVVGVRNVLVQLSQIHPRNQARIALTVGEELTQEVVARLIGWLTKRAAGTKPRKLRGRGTKPLNFMD